MSILTKSYEISVWDDVLEGGDFVEKRLGVIGSDKMIAQCRALEPTLTRNVNGTKKFSFKMYAQYIDNATGEKTKNPFVDWLISERKVKLKYGSKWFDFIIKDISENSSTHLYTYQLEDALVQELSKNGFGITLDAESMNNMGTANELGDFVLEETDWEVESEAFVEKIEEALVYVQFPGEVPVTRIFDQQKDDDGNWSTGITTRGTTIDQTDNNQLRYALAFYSSCTDKPHRFQFIYLSDGYYQHKPQEYSESIPKEIIDENGVIKVKDCQYYIDIADPEGYEEVSVSGLPTFYLPKGWFVVGAGNPGIGNSGDTTISNWYRGARYGFAQQAKYIPLLGRYCQKFQKAGTNYYGYVDTRYDSPALLQNIVTNNEFKGTSGWVGTYNGSSANEKNTYGAKIESVYGTLTEAGFTSVVNYLSNGTYEVEDTYTPYLKVTFPATNDDDDNKGILINTGFYDNRTTIGSVEENELWYFKPTILSSTGEDVSSHFTYKLQEVSYNPDKDTYELKTPWAEQLIVDKKATNFMKFTSAVKVTADQFKKKEVKLVIYPTTDPKSETTYYVKDIQLYKYIETGTVDEDGEPIYLEPGKVELEGVTTTTYKLFPASSVEGDSAVSSVEDIAYDTVDKKSMDFDTYVPVYNEGAQKVRSITAKESNYFNILQSIAETFECWVDLVIEREDQSAPGRVTGKKVKFKNYAGEDNHASFRYGVNLKDIQRTYASKNIVTKLVVKANSNEHAKNGFCTIQRAGANPTGESYIYDFRYFHDKGLLDSKEYIAEMYYTKNPLNGNKISSDNVQNYLNRIKTLNQEITDLNDEIIPLQQDLTELKANLAVEEGLLEAANESIQEIQEEFLQLTGMSIGQISVDNFIDTDCTVPAPTAEFGVNNLNSSWAENASIRVVNNPDGDKFDWTFTITLASQTSTYDRTLYFQPTFQFYVGTEEKPIEVTTAKKSIRLSCTIPAGKNTAIMNYTRAPVDTTASNIANLLTQYATYQAQRVSSTKKINGYAEDGEVLYSGLKNSIETKEQEIANKQSTLKEATEAKKTLNKEFFKKYSRFIQEGTWISEEYIDDDKYYIDALSVMYNSCYPQVAYTINVLSLSGLEGYELFDFEVGDKTFAEDPDFFGTDKKEEVIIAELSENLDDPSKSTIRVQNFKNQFQDLFQKITATVQQAQYSTGSYEKAVALAEASAEVKGEFLLQAISNANTKLTNAGQTTVIQDVNGITLIDAGTQDQMRLIGGAILMSVQDPKTGERKWKTGLTPEGISATMLTAGSIDTRSISIKNGNDITFMLNEYGITAFDADWGGNGVTGIDTSKFVRFDKHGVYGIAPNNGITPNGVTWKPDGGLSKWDVITTFSLTWEGLKVTGNNNVVARLGKLNGNILDITDAENQSLMSFSDNGTLTVGGWSVSQNSLNSSNEAVPQTYSLRRTVLEKVSSPQVFLSSQGRKASFCNSNGSVLENVEDVVFKAGDHFMVTNEGKLYANSGQIGPLAIENVASKDDIDGKMDSSASSASFSWLFDKTSGMFMWDKERPSTTAGNRGAIFAIYQEGETKKLYIKGNVVADAGKIGGWTLNSTSLTSGDFGKDGGFHMYTSPYTTQGSFGTSTESPINWYLGIGSNLGITTSGEIYCRKLNFIDNASNAPQMLLKCSSAEVCFFGKKTADGWIRDMPSCIAIQQNSALATITTNGIMWGPSFTQTGDGQVNQVEISARIGNEPDLHVIWGPAGNRKTVKFSDLVFNGSYEIRYGSNSGDVVGKLYRMGPLVYGRLRSDLNISVRTDKYLYVTTASGVSATDVKMRESPIWVAWFNQGNNNMCRLKLTRGVNDLLEIYVEVVDTNHALAYNSVSATYFAYSLNSTYDLP